MKNSHALFSLVVLLSALAIGNLSCSQKKVQTVDTLPLSASAPEMAPAGPVDLGASSSGRSR